MKVKRYRSIHTAPRHRSTSQWSPASYVEIALATLQKKTANRKATSSARCSLATCSARICRSVWTTRRAKNRPENKKLHRFFTKKDKKPRQRYCQKVWFLHSGHVNFKLPILASVQVAVTAPRFSEPSLPATMTFCEPGSQTVSSTRKDLSTNLLHSSFTVELGYLEYLGLLKSSTCRISKNWQGRSLRPAGRAFSELICLDWPTQRYAHGWRTSRAIKLTWRISQMEESGVSFMAFPKAPTSSQRRCNPKIHANAPNNLASHKVL